jgi:hypothetical protein
MEKQILAAGLIVDRSSQGPYIERYVDDVVHERKDEALAETEQRYSSLNSSL